MINKKKIGLVTFFNGNYGSILQCFAMKMYLEDMGYQCVVIYEKDTCEEVKRCSLKKYKKIINIIKNSVSDISYPIRWIKYRKVPMALTDETIRKMNRFVNTNISPIEIAQENLPIMGNDETFEAFIVGSDQVWNVNNEDSPIYRLDFAPRKKRIAYAVSLGVEHIDRRHGGILKKNIGNFDSISVREKSGKKLIDKVANTPVNICVVSDPTLFFDKHQWGKFCDKTVDIKGFVIVIHFLNHPSEIAIDTILKIQHMTNGQVVCLGYKYSVFERLGWNFVSCDPFEYVAYIDKASFICTDSYHTTLFSINLDKNFYVFERMYMHGFPQTDRINCLLERYHLSDRFISRRIKNITLEYEHNYFDIIEKDRDVSKKYLTNSIGKIKNKAD